MRPPGRGDPGRAARERQERTGRRLLVVIGILLGAIAFTLMVQNDPFGMGPG